VAVGQEQREVGVCERWVLWHITRRCNIECEYCYGSFFGASYKKLGRDIRELSADRCVRLLFELGDCGIDAVHINGGEPLTRPDLAPILRRARDAHVKKWLLTNGTIRGRPFDAISCDGLVDMLAISLDSHRSDVNEVGRQRTAEARRSLEILADRKRSGTLSCKLGVYIVLSRDSLATFDSYVEWLCALDVDYVNMQPVYLPPDHGVAAMSLDALDISQVERAYQELEARLPTSSESMRWLALRTLGGVTGHAANCFADRGDYFYINPNGLVYGCPVKADATAIAVGNLHTHDLSQIAGRRSATTACSKLCGDCLGMYEMASGAAGSDGHNVKE
jgi:MoaA/NifB/PqqE/SkfB family radical SAM enzyme